MADSITFLDNPVSINDIKQDAQLYFSENGAHKNDCEYFGSDGKAGFPDDTYSIADVRMQIQLGKKVGEPVIFTIDCLLEDGRYSSDIDPNKIKKQMDWDDFIKLDVYDYSRKIIQPLVKDLQNWAKAEESKLDGDLRSFLKAHELFKGQRPENVGDFIAKNIVKFLSPIKATEEELKANAKSISNNLARSIEANNANAQDFFKACFVNVTEDDLTTDFWKNVASLHKDYFPEITKDEVTSKQKPVKRSRLAKNINEPQEVLNALHQHMTDPYYKNAMKTKIVDEIDASKSDPTLTKFWQAILAAFNVSNKIDSDI